MSASLDATVTSFGLALLAAIGGCSSEPTTASNAEPPKNGKPGAGYDIAANGIVVREGPARCDPTISAASCKGTEDSKDCSSDADCKAGPHGKCITGAAGPGPSMAPRSFCGCVYACAADDDCGKDQVCVCGDARDGDSQCVTAFCRGDDCDGGRCEYSKYFDGCSDAEYLQCKSSADACQRNHDCPKGTTCALDMEGPGAKPSWACRRMPCTVGRPLLVDGSERFAPAVERSEWLLAHDEPLGALLSPAERRRIAHHYLEIAALEHASVASFARFSLGLLALGAPPELLLESSRAALDEVRHAKLCYGLAHAYGEPRQGPGALPEAALPMAVDVVSFTRALVLEGCVGETLSALEAQHVASSVTEPKLGATLARIAEDELRHAVLAFKTLRWLAHTFDGTRAAAEEALGEARAALAAHEALPSGQALAEHGMLGDEGRVRLRRAAFEAVVAGPVACAVC